MIEDVGIKFLIATDVHLGHKQKHSVRQNDSFQAFQECISHAKQNNVDFILLGGDLFDQVNPSKQCFFKCLSILQRNVFGNTKIKLKVTLNGSEYKSNFQNQGINIQLPIFTIHGNHDYPTNQYGKISVCDLLQASNYVNYFGKYTRLDNIVIRPLIITKQDSRTKIALYGLGYIKDLALNQLFAKDKISFQKPYGNIEDYVTIFVLHQNRYKKGFQTGAPLSKSFDVKNIPEWINITIWGHQHQAIYRIDEQLGRKIYQPGSTVITSYIEAEAIKKQCVLFTAKGTKYEIKSILLEKSFRPMHCQQFQYSLLKQRFGHDLDLANFFDQIIGSILQQSNSQYKKQPIIRFKVQYTGVEDIMKVKQIESKYARKVANFDKIFTLWKKKEENQKVMSQQQFIRKLKNKESLKDSYSNTLTQTVQKIFKQNLQKFTFTHFNKEDNIKMFSELGRSETKGCKDFITRKLQDSLQKRNHDFNSRYNKGINVFQKQFKKFMKYYHDKKQFAIKGSINKDYYHVQNYQKFQQLQKTLITNQQFQNNCQSIANLVQICEREQKLMHNKISQDSQQNRIFQRESTNQNYSKSQEKMNKLTTQRTTASMEKKKEIDSQEDCCEKALKTPYDEQGTKMKFQEIHSRVKAQDKNKNKKSSFLTKQKKETQRPDKAPQKNRFSNKIVRFSDNF